VLRTLRTGRSSIMIHEHTSAEGQTSYFNIATYPIKDENGAIIRIIELWREITREISYRWEKRVRRMETDMKRMIQEDRMISLGRLVASCVHEINNPIQGLLAFADLMQVILDEEEMTEANKNDLKKYAGLMSRELERCGSIISGLLSFSYESGMEYREMDLNEILGSVLTLTRHKMELSDIRPTIRLHPAPLPVVGDKNQLQQCFLNLIFNAAEAMPDGGELFVRSAVTEDNRSRIDIRDTGCGIPEDDMDHIFDPFFTTKEEGKGLGLGLFMVYGMVKNHKGTVKAESREGEGTRFVLTFPRP
jgi:signal transduction histidine kinase